MRMRRTIVDVADVDGRSELDELGEALRFAARVTGPDVAVATGPRLDAYRLVERVATTTCAEVFTAWDPTRAKTVVVALLRDAGNTESTRAALRSPIGGFAPLAGTSLDTWLRTRSSAAAVLAIYRDIAHGLAACRSAGIDTGAFSPTSIVVDAQGSARIVLPNLHACETTDVCAGIGPAVARALSRRPGASALQAALERIAPATIEEWSDALGVMLREARA